MILKAIKSYLPSHNYINKKIRVFVPKKLIVKILDIPLSFNKDY